MTSPLDRFAPSSSFAFPDGPVLTIGTVTRDDRITKDVLISYEDPSDPKSGLQIILPTNSVDHVIRALQERANEARFVNGERMLDYTQPTPDSPKLKQKRKPRPRKQSGPKKPEADD